MPFDLSALNIAGLAILVLGFVGAGFCSGAFTVSSRVYGVVLAIFAYVAMAVIDSTLYVGDELNRIFSFHTIVFIVTLTAGAFVGIIVGFIRLRFAGRPS